MRSRALSPRHNCSPAHHGAREPPPRPVPAAPAPDGPSSGVKRVLPRRRMCILLNYPRVCPADPPEHPVTRRSSATGSVFLKPDPRNNPTFQNLVSAATLSEAGMLPGSADGGCGSELRLQRWRACAILAPTAASMHQVAQYSFTAQCLPAHGGPDGLYVSAVHCAASRRHGALGTLACVAAAWPERHCVASRRACSQMPPHL